MSTAKRFRGMRWFGLGLAGVLVCAGAMLAQDGPVQETDADHRAERVADRLLLPIQVRGRRPDFRRIEDRMRVHRVPAVSVAVIERGEIQWSRAWGVADESNDGSATPDTRFQAASISKPLSALAVLRLVEAGRIELDEDVGEYLGGWDVPRADGVSGAITSRALLSHSAGLTVHGFTGYRAGATVPSTVEILDGAGPANSPRVIATSLPGSEWRYSGGGYTVAQLLVETLTGRPFDSEMRDILDELGMTNSTYAQPLPDSLAPVAAVGHRASRDPLEGRWHTYPEMAAAGLWTTAGDLALYAIAVGNWMRGETGGLLTPSMARTMVQPGLGEWGLGPQTSGDGLDFRFHHGGANEGFRSELVYFPRRGLGAVILTNSDNGSPLIQEILAGIAQEYDWPAYRAQEIRVLELTAAAGRQYAGRYRLEAAPDVQVTTRWRRGRLELQIGDAEPSEIFYVARDRFVIASDGADLRFERDASGRVSAMIAFDTRARRIRPPQAGSPPRTLP